MEKEEKNDEKTIPEADSGKVVPKWPHPKILLIGLDEDMATALKADVPKDVSGDLAGIRTALTMVQAKKGVRVFRIKDK